MSDSLDPDVGSRVRFLDRTLPTVEENLALDEALLLAAEEHGAGPVLRVWEWPTLAVVLGASGRLHEDVEVERCRDEGVQIARRSSGGGTVLIGPGAVNLTVILPADAAPGLSAVDAAQTFVLERLAGSLASFGPPVRIQGSGDLTLGDRKFAGSAQRRLRRNFLVHTSLLYDFSLPTISRYTRLPKRQPSYRAGRSHTEFLTNLPLPRTDILSAVRIAWISNALAEYPVNLLEPIINEIVASKFADPGWINRL